MGLRSIPSALNTKMLTPLPMLVPGSTPPAGAGFDRRRWRTSAELQFQTHVRALAARIASELSLSFRPRNRRGRREGRVPTAPMVRVQLKHAAEPQVQADHPAFPAQWFYGLYVISPVTMLGCHRRLRVVSRKLSACIGAPGPHDFAVCTNAARRATIALGDVRPSHPAPTARDDREPPLFSGAG